MFKVSIDKNKCIGCGTCVAVCKNFKIKDGKAYLKKAKVEKITCEKEAKESCPTQAINITK
jgi:ferredoxin